MVQPSAGYSTSIVSPPLTELFLYYSIQKYIINSFYSMKILKLSTSDVTIFGKYIIVIAVICMIPVSHE